MNQLIHFLLACFFTLPFSASLAQNIGIGTSNPLEKLHIAGALRADNLQIAVANTSPSDKLLWADANGKVYTLSNGTIGKVLGINNLGVVDWLNAGLSNNLNNGQIWIGDAANLPQAQTMFGDAILSNTGLLTIQDDAVDGTDISILGETNGSMMYFNGTDWVNLGIGNAGQVLVSAGGLPTWLNANTLYTAGNLTTSTSAVNIIGGTAAVLGTGTSIDIANNALNQNGLVTGTTLANAFQVWGADVNGNPNWQNVNTLLATKDIVAGGNNNALLVTNGGSQVVGALNAVISVANNAFNQAGVVAAPSGANVNQVWATDNFGNPAWTAANDVLIHENALTEILPNTVRWGGALTQNTTVDFGNFNTNFNLSGTGNLRISSPNGIMLQTNAATGNLLLGNTIATNSAILDASGINNKGYRLPQISLTSNLDITTVPNPAPSLLIYNTATAGAGANAVTPGYHYWDGSIWQKLQTNLSTTNWQLDGNLNPTLKYIGTNNNFDFPFRTNGTEKMRLTTNGKLLIGTPTPGAFPFAKLELADDTGANSDFVMRTGGGNSYLVFLMQASQGTIAAPTAKPANTLIGMYEFQAHNGAGFQPVANMSCITGAGFSAANVLGHLYFSTKNTTDAAPVNRMAILANGQIGIGTNAPDQLLSVNGNASKVGGGTWATFSDKRLKQNIRPFEEGLEVLMKINPVSFEYNGLAGYPLDNKQYIGVIAQEIAEVAPYMVEKVAKKLQASDTENTDLLMYDASALTYIMANAIKQQQAEIDRLNARLAALEKLLN